MFEHCSKKSDYKMSSIQKVVFRTIITFGMLVAVMAIVYFSPLPDTTIHSCDRPCHAIEWPMICRIKLLIEAPPDMKETCDNIVCTNETDGYCSKDFCMLNNDNRIILVNNQIPAPSIQVCQNDILVVDVINKISDHSLTIHWRGQPNDETPFMDGVPLVTQCPITSFSTFQYKFRASAAGTHFYHAHSHQDWSRGLHGSFVVRQPDKFEPHRKLYDVDSKSHVILISEWAGNNLLINGKGASKEMPNFSVFSVEKGRRYRFRVAYTGGVLGCPITIEIDNHLLKVIALDGNSINPYESDSIILSKGERVDFVLKANQDVNRYFFKVKSECTREGLAILNYEGSVGDNVNNKLTLKKATRKFDTIPCESQIGKVCLGDVKSLQKMPEGLRKSQLEVVLYLSYKSKIINTNGFNSRVWEINNFTFSYPASPLLTQLREVSINSICDEVNVPEKCLGKDVCECVHVEFLPSGARTEIILIDEDGSEEEQIFHLHGHKFYLVGSTSFETSPVREQIKLLNQENKLLKRNLNSPPLKDTVRVPRNGVVALRFEAKNSGFWILRDEKSKAWTRGMDMIFQVGDLTDMVSTPSNFPTCGNYIGPEFFLI